MAVPEADLQQILRWAQAKVPPELSSKVRYEVDVVGSSVTLYDCRPPWQPDQDPTWLRQEVLKLKWTEKYGTWSLFWVDRDSKFHVYGRVPPTARIGTHLAEIDADPTFIFWG